MFSGSVLEVLKTKTECAVPENIHTPPHRKYWKFLGGGGGGGGSQRTRNLI